MSLIHVQATDRLYRMDTPSGNAELDALHFATIKILAVISQVADPYVIAVVTAGSDYAQADTRVRLRLDQLDDRWFQRLSR